MWGNEMPCHSQLGASDSFIPGVKGALLPHQVHQRCVCIEGSQNRVVVRKVHTVSVIEEEPMMMKVLCVISDKV